MGKTTTNAIGWRQPRVIAAAVMLAVTVAVAITMVLPAWRTHHQAQAQQARLTQKQDAAQKLQQTLTKMRHQLALARRAVARHPLQLAQSGALNQRLSQVTSMAARFDLQVDALKPGQSHARTHYVCQPIRLSGQGRFESAIRFLHALHQQLPDMGVQAFKLNADPGQTGAKPTFGFDLRWYAAPDNRQ